MTLLIKLVILSSSNSSYVLSGAAMRVTSNPMELQEFLEQAAVSSQKIILLLLPNSCTNAREIECMMELGEREKRLYRSHVEHIENAGVHSGDATICIPAPTLSYRMWEESKYHHKNCVRHWKSIGPFNIQYLVKDGGIYVIEMNLPQFHDQCLMSVKTIGVNLIKLAAHVIMGGILPEELIEHSNPPFVSNQSPAIFLHAIRRCRSYLKC